MNHQFSNEEFLDSLRRKRSKER